MEFTDGISPLTHKSIAFHNQLLLDNQADVIADAQNVMSEWGDENRPTVVELEKYFLVFLTVSNDWANERREVSKIGK